MIRQYTTLVIVLSAIGGLLLNWCSVFFLTITIPAFALIIFQFSAYRHTLKLFPIVAFIILSDVLIRLKYWGGCDMEGLAWQMMFTLIGVGIVFGLLAIRTFTDTQTKWGKKLQRVALFVALLAAYFTYFSQLGMVCENNTTKSEAEAKAQNVFLGRITYSDNILVYNTDTFKLQDGWVEKETQINHTNFFKRTEFTNKYVYVIPVEGIFKDHGHTDRIYWRNVPNVNGSSPIEPVLKLSADMHIAEPRIYFFSGASGYSMIKEIKIRQKQK